MILFLLLPTTGAQAKDVTLDGATVAGPTSDIKVTYALNSTQKIARVKEVRNVGANGSRNTCVIPSKIKVNKTTYTVTIIGKNAFGYETFSKVVLPSTITEICESAFGNMGFLSKLEIPSSVTTIGKNAFYHTSLYSITIPASVTYIGEGAFAGNLLHYVTFAAGSAPLTIGANAFAKNSIGALTLPTRLANLGAGAFSDNLRLTNVVINGNINVIPARCFYNCSMLAFVTVNSRITTVAESAFENCEIFGSFMPQYNSLMTIGKNAFANCNFRTLDQSTLGYGLTDIGPGAFSNNPNLTSVILPFTISSIGSAAFANCNNIATIDCHTLHVPLLAEDAFPAVVYKNCAVSVYDHIMPQFKTAAGWRLFNWPIAGIDDITISDDEFDVEYFNLRGEPVSNPAAPGIYIERRNGKTRKIYLH